MTRHRSFCFYFLLIGLAIPGFWAMGATAENQKKDEIRFELSAAERTQAENSMGKSLEVTLADAVLMALENNQGLQVERLNPVIQQSYEQEARAAFDPNLEIGASLAHENRRNSPETEDSLSEADSDIYQGAISLETFFPSGTTLTATADTSLTEDNLDHEELAATRLGVRLTQALLRGFGRDVNLVNLRQARLLTDITRYQLLGFSQSLVTQVETAYWDFALAQRQVEIVAESLKLARQQLSETLAMIQVGTLAESELAAVQAEVAIQQQGSINVKSALEINRLRLLQLINPPGPNLWERSVSLVHPPVVPDIKLSKVDVHVAVALHQRPEIQQADLQIRKGELELVRTKNGLLPKLDLFISLGKSGYAESFGESVNDLGGDSYDYQAGLAMAYPLFNRQAEGRHLRARNQRQQAEKALENLKQLVALDIRTAYLEVNRTRQQIDASKATRRFQDEKLRIETEKFRVGRSTNLLVAQAQRDLLASRLDEVRAVVDYLKAITNFYRLEGTLLDRRGIRIPE